MSVKKGMSSVLFNMKLTEFFPVVYIFTILLEIDGYIEIGSLPATVSVHEDVTSATFLHSVQAYYPDGSATCSISAGNTGSNFQLTVESGQQNIYTVASPTFAFDTLPSYSLTIQCVLAGGDTVTGTLTVNLIENSAPVYTNLPGAVTISAKTVKANTVIFTVSYTDTDTSPPLTYSNLATNPVGGPFSLTNDQLKVTADLTAHATGYYDVTFDVTDGRTASTGKTITVTINDINTVPAFVNGPSVTKSIPEHTSTRTLIYDIEHTDVDNDAVQYEYQVVLPANSIWNLDGATGEIYLVHGNALDYETTNQYILTVKISDYIAEAATYFTVTIDVTDVPEAPTYIGSPSAVSKDESASGTVIGIPDQLCTDPDGIPPDSISYAILSSTYSAYFSIDSTTAQVSFAQNWDFDTSLPANVNLTIRCSDLLGYSDDATYQITVLDINDNDPVCSPSQTDFTLRYDQTVGSTIVNLQCSDLDSTVNAELDYTMIGLASAYTVTYFTSDASGNVSISTTFAMDYNTTFYVTVRVTDRGTPSRSTTVTLTVSYIEEPAVYVYTEVDPCFLCTTGAITIVAALGFIAVIIVIFCCVLCFLRCCFDFERKQIIKHLRKRKKKQWRLCGCLRPGREIRKPKKTRRQIDQAEKKDREYERARNALQGKTEPPVTNIPSEAVYFDPGQTVRQSTKTSKSSSKVRTPAGQSFSPPPSVPPPATYSLKGREPGSNAPLDPRIVTPNSLTVTQKEHLNTFKKMQQDKDQGHGALPTISEKPPTGPTKRLKHQAASGMVWTFKGREDDSDW